MNKQKKKTQKQAKKKNIPAHFRTSFIVIIPLPGSRTLRQRRRVTIRQTSYFCFVDNFFFFYIMSVYTTLLKGEM